MYVRVCTYVRDCACVYVCEHVCVRVCFPMLLVVRGELGRILVTLSLTNTPGEQLKTHTSYPPRKSQAAAALPGPASFVQELVSCENQ